MQMGFMITPYTCRQHSATHQILFEKFDKDLIGNKNKDSDLFLQHYLTLSVRLQGYPFILASRKVKSLVI
jgi:hypothetical protein